MKRNVEGSEGAEEDAEEEFWRDWWLLNVDL
jgi:hypothetical protein